MTYFKMPSSKNQYFPVRRVLSPVAFLQLIMFTAAVFDVHNAVELKQIDKTAEKEGRRDHQRQKIEHNVQHYRPKQQPVNNLCPRKELQYMAAVLHGGNYNQNDA